jgi:hypothetical protein
MPITVVSDSLKPNDHRGLRRLPILASPMLPATIAFDNSLFPATRTEYSKPYLMVVFPSDLGQTLRGNSQHFRNTR